MVFLPLQTYVLANNFKEKARRQHTPKKKKINIRNNVHQKKKKH